ncbi:MAG: hypothetical protein HDT39_09200 [Lachnospiraceae bacterium]|nr:hypothetical protein [Lachnospiraceae bacterium]
MNTIRCPKCRKMINKKDTKCGYCGFDGIHTYVSKQKRTESDVFDGNNSNVSWKEIFVLCIIVIAAFWLLGSWVGTGNNSKEEKCQVCYKTFTNNDDVHSIIMTNMCENCYSNFKYTQDLKEELKKYEERYGD